MRVDAFLDRHPGFELCEVSPEVRACTADGVFFEGCRHPEITKCRRFYPHIAPGEGQFIAVMQNRGGAVREICYADSAVKPSASDEKTAKGFLSENMVKLPDGKTALVGKNISLIPDFPVPPRSVFSAGVKLGTAEKGRLVPHHQFFSAFGRDFTRKIEIGLDERACAKYLSGETFNFDLPDGWAAVTVHGMPLGGAKTVSGVVKNHYPKGLRIR